MHTVSGSYSRPYKAVRSAYESLVVYDSFKFITFNAHVLAGFELIFSCDNIVPIVVLLIFKISTTVKAA